MGSSSLYSSTTSRITERSLIAFLLNQWDKVLILGLKTPSSLDSTLLTTSSHALTSLSLLIGVILTLVISLAKGSMSIPKTWWPASSHSTSVVPHPQNGSSTFLNFFEERYLLIPHSGTWGMNLEGYLWMLWVKYATLPLVIMYFWPIGIVDFIGRSRISISLIHFFSMTIMLSRR